MCAEMMKVTPGPLMDDATRAALASGRAEPSLGLFLDALMEMRGVSGGEGEAIAGAVLEAETPVALPLNALEMAFAAIDHGAAHSRPETFVYPELGAVPALLRAAILEAEAKGAWGRVGPGIRNLPLRLGGEAKAGIIRLEPGMAIPWHTHKGQELTLCLYGEFSDSRGVYGPGDVSIAGASVRHRPLAHDKGPVYALVVTDDALKFEGLLGALQKLLGP